MCVDGCQSGGAGCSVGSFVFVNDTRPYGRWVGEWQSLMAGVGGYMRVGGRTNFIQLDRKSVV